MSTSANWRELEQQILKVIKTGVRPGRFTRFPKVILTVRWEHTRTILRFRRNGKKKRSRC